MEACVVRSLLAAESAPPPLRIPSAPAKAVPRTYPAVPQRDQSVELPRMERILSSPTTTPRAAGSGAATPAEPGDLEMSRPGTPCGRSGDDEPDGIDAVQSMWDPFVKRFRLLSVCLMNFGSGLNDSAPGALIPHLEASVELSSSSFSPSFSSSSFFSSSSPFSSSSFFSSCSPFSLSSFFSSS